MPFFPVESENGAKFQEFLNKARPDYPKMIDTLIMMAEQLLQLFVGTGAIIAVFICQLASSVFTLMFTLLQLMEMVIDDGRSDSFTA
jgi:hypothetical protein